MSQHPHLSVILPVYNRVALLSHPLRSLRAAAAASPDLVWELIVIDDASTENVPAALGPFADLPLSMYRLAQNSGLLSARLEGLARARGDAILFLDADDAIAPEKFGRQLPALAAADVVHGDTARCSIDSTGRPCGPLRLDPPAKTTVNPATFYLTVQPAPHDPIFRRSYLLAALQSPVCPPSRTYDPIAEAWLYYQLALQPGRIAYCPGPWSIVGEPAGDRLSRNWERQCAAALQLMDAFLSGCPVTPDTLQARRLIGRAAFATWRALPYGFAPADRLLSIWRRCPPSPLTELGGGHFARAARCLGPVLAGRLFRLMLRPAYRRISTLSEPEVRKLFRDPAHPPAKQA